MLPFLAENNGLLFLETSALDSTNVELAFQTVLKGESLPIGYLLHSGWDPVLTLSSLWPLAYSEPLAPPPIPPLILGLREATGGPHVLGG